MPCEPNKQLTARNATAVATVAEQPIDCPWRYNTPHDLEIAPVCRPSALVGSMTREEQKNIAHEIQLSRDFGPGRALVSDETTGAPLLVPLQTKAGVHGQPNFSFGVHRLMGSPDAVVFVSHHADALATNSG